MNRVLVGRFGMGEHTSLCSERVQRRHRHGLNKDRQEVPTVWALTGMSLGSLKRGFEKCDGRFPSLCGGRRVVSGRMCLVAERV